MTDINQNTNPGEQKDVATGQQTQENTQPDLSVITKAIETATSKKETAILKDFFSKQGLDEAGVQQAINDYKAKQEANKPNPDAINQELEQTKKVLAKTQLENRATLSALKLGVDINTVPYLLKMVDLKNVESTDEEIIEELNKILEVIPGLKKTQEQNSGFQKIGADSNQGNNTADQDALMAAFGVKKK